jgi:LPS export ABC transporter permease LptG
LKIERYFARAYAAAFLLVQLGLVIIVVATTLVENAGNLSKSDETAWTAVLLALYGSVQFGYQVLPVACFLSVLVAGTMMARTGELLAVQAAGVSATRIAVALGLVAVMIAAFGGFLGETAVPAATEKLEALQREQLGKNGDPLTRFYNRRTQWFREGDLLLYLPDVDTEERTFSDVVVYRFDHGIIAAVTEAGTLTQTEGAWWLGNVRQHDLNTGTITTVDKQRLDLHVTPRELLDVTGDPRVMPTSAIAELVDRRKKAGFDATPYRLEQYSRLAFPASALGMFLLAIPWALNPNRRRSLAVNLGTGVALVAVLLSLTHVFRLLALGRKIPAPIGAWGVNLVCVVGLPLSFWLYRRWRTRGSLF